MFTRNPFLGKNYRVTDQDDAYFDQDVQGYDEEEFDLDIEDDLHTDPSYSGLGDDIEVEIDDKVSDYSYPERCPEVKKGEDKFVDGVIDDIYKDKFKVTKRDKGQYYIFNEKNPKEYIYFDKDGEVEVWTAKDVKGESFALKNLSKLIGEYLKESICKEEAKKEVIEELANGDNYFEFRIYSFDDNPEMTNADWNDALKRFNLKQLGEKDFRDMMKFLIVGKEANVRRLFDEVSDNKIPADYMIADKDDWNIEDEKQGDKKAEYSCMTIHYRDMEDGYEKNYLEIIGPDDNFSAEGDTLEELIGNVEAQMDYIYPEGFEINKENLDVLRNITDLADLDGECLKFKAYFKENLNEAKEYPDLFKIIDDIQEYLDIKYDILKPVTKEEIGSDIHYHQEIKTVNQAERFNYHSDYWGYAEGYQDDNVYAMEQLRPYIGKKVELRYEDDEPEVVTLICMLIDKQYNSITHTKLLVEPLIKREGQEEAINEEVDSNENTVYFDSTDGKDIWNMDDPEVKKDFDRTVLDTAEEQDALYADFSDNDDYPLVDYIEIDDEEKMDKFCEIAWDFFAMDFEKFTKEDVKKLNFKDPKFVDKVMDRFEREAEEEQEREQERRRNYDLTAEPEWNEDR